MGWCHFLTECVLFWEMDAVFFGWERVNFYVVVGEIKLLCVVPVSICLVVVVKKANPTAFQGVCSGWSRVQWSARRGFFDIWRLHPFLDYELRFWPLGMSRGINPSPWTVGMSDCAHGSGLKENPNRVDPLRLVWFVVKKEKPTILQTIVLFLWLDDCL